MPQYQFTPEAADDLFDIWSFIARTSVTAADRVEEAIFGACALVADGPGLGHIRKELEQNQGRCISKPHRSSRRDQQGAATWHEATQDIVSLVLL